MSRIRSFIGQQSGRVMTVGAAAVVAGAIAAPLATGANDGSTLKGGQRNGTFTSETKIIANNGAFGTRQSNLGAGGGAIYGCRAANAGRGCIEASNLNNGQAFNFRFRGPIGGTITTNATTPTAQAQAKPFTTNATSVATGLNADRLDGQHAADQEGNEAGVTVDATTGSGGCCVGQDRLRRQRGGGMISEAAHRGPGRSFYSGTDRIDRKTARACPQWRRVIRQPARQRSAAGQRGAIFADASLELGQAPPGNQDDVPPS